MHLMTRCLYVIFLLFSSVSGHVNHPQQAYGQPQQQFGIPQTGQHIPVGNAQTNQGGNLLRDKSQVQDRAHIQEHLQEILGDEQDLSKMSEDELQFHYFKLHDNDNNNRLDGLELVKSLIHWHVEEHKHMQASQGTQGPPPASHDGHATTKIFDDDELQKMIDPILEMDDTNRDGYIDYAEFVSAQKQRGF